MITRATHSTPLDPYTPVLAADIRPSGTQLLVTPQFSESCVTGKLRVHLYKELPGGLPQMVPLYLPPAMVRAPISPLPPQHLPLYFLIIVTAVHPGECEVQCHGFDFHLSSDCRCRASFLVHIGHLYVFGEMSIQTLCPLHTWVICLFIKL